MTVGCMHSWRMVRIGQAYAALALAACATMAVACAPDTESSTSVGELTVAQRTELCDRLGTDLVQSSSRLREDERLLPDTVVTFGDQTRWLHLYLGDHVLVSCVSTEDGTDALVEIDRSGLVEPDAVWLQGDLLAHVARQFAGGQSFLVVGVPAGTVKLEVALADGTEVRAERVPEANRFVAWLPDHLGDGLAAIEDLTIVAYTDDAILTLEDEAVTSRPRN